MPDRPRILTQKRLATVSEIASLLFPEAAKAWLDLRLDISETTRADYSHYISRLSAFFAELTPEQIDGDVIRAYQQMRMAHVGASVINHECSVIQQILKHVGRWPVPGGYAPLRLPKESPGRCLEDWERERYFQMAASNPTWEVAYHATRIMDRSGICPGELCKVRLLDVDGEHQAIRIMFGKNDHRERWVPCTPEAWESVKALLARAEKLGSKEPHHHLLPFRSSTGHYDPAAPSKGWRTAHEEICAAAGIKMRRYDWRHTAATRLLQNPNVSTETAIAILGHVSARMVRRVYNHSRYHVMRDALISLDSNPKTKPPKKL